MFWGSLWSRLPCRRRVQQTLVSLQFSKTLKFSVFAFPWCCCSFRGTQVSDQHEQQQQQQVVPARRRAADLVPKLVRTVLQADGAPEAAHIVRVRRRAQVPVSRVPAQVRVQLQHEETHGTGAQVGVDDGTAVPGASRPRLNPGCAGVAFAFRTSPDFRR